MILQQGIQWVAITHELKLGILLVVLLVVVLVFVGRQTNDRRSANIEVQPSPLEKLQLRYIHGELTEAQYQKLRQELTHG